MSDDTPDRPSCSKTSRNINDNRQRTVADEENVELYINNEKVEIEGLDSEKCVEISNEKDDKTNNSQKDERVVKIKFYCSSCEMEEMVDYFGLDPEFVFGIKFTERTYVMRDPFQPPPPRWKSRPEYFIALGAHCKECNQVVCKDIECSFFYVNTYCLRCVKKVVNIFPLDIKQKLKKQLSSIQFL